MVRIGSLRVKFSLGIVLLLSGLYGHCAGDEHRSHLDLPGLIRASHESRVKDTQAPSLAEPNDRNQDELIYDPAELREISQSFEFKSFREDFKRALKDDRVGTLVITVITTYDVVIWMTANNHSLHVRSMEAAYSVLLSLFFSVDKDQWPKLAHLTKRKLRNTIAYRELYQRAGPDQAELVAYLGANFAMGLATQIGRYSILYMDASNTSAFLLQSCGDAICLALAYTIGSTSWSELLYSIDQSRHPRLKMLIRRLNEMKSMALGYFAPSGKLLQPHEYGWAGWATLAVSGGMGFIGLKIKEKILGKRPVIHGADKALEAQKLPEADGLRLLQESPDQVSRQIPASDQGQLQLETQILDPRTKELQELEKQIEELLERSNRVVFSRPLVTSKGSRADPEKNSAPDSPNSTPPTEEVKPLMRLEIGAFCDRIL